MWRNVPASLHCVASFRDEGTVVLVGTAMCWTMALEGPPAAR